MEIIAILYLPVFFLHPSLFQQIGGQKHAAFSGTAATSRDVCDRVGRPICRKPANNYTTKSLKKQDFLSL